MTAPDSLVAGQEAAGPPGAKGRIITFYSYKGGTGRSMALANVAFVLALGGNRVLVIDWDLEAPGIHRYFHPFLEDKELQATEGLLDMVENLAAHAAASDKPLSADQVDIIPYIEPLEWPRDTPHRVSWRTFGPRARIDLLPAGRQGPAYTRKLSAFNWVDFYEKLGGRRLLGVAKAQMRDIYDYILIDSRTGVSDTSGICTVEMPDTLVVCFTLNDQSIRGAAAVAESVREQRRSWSAATADQHNRAEVADNGEFRIFPVPTRVEITSEREKREAALDLAKETFSTFLTAMSPEAQARYWGSVQMAYFPFYAFEEIPAIFGDQANDLLSLTTAITQITRMITDPPVGDVRPLAEDIVTAEAIRKEILRWYLRRSARPLGDPARLAQEVFEQFDEQAKSEMMRVLLRIVVVRPTTEPSAKTVTFEELDDSGQGMVQTLADRGLVVISETGRERSVALADVDLLKGWNTLRERIHTDRRFLMWRQTLGAAAESWRQNGFDESALWRGRVLEEALNFARMRRGDLNTTEFRFIDASSALEQKRLESEERERAHVASLIDSLQKEREAIEKLRAEVAVGSSAPGGGTANAGRQDHRKRIWLLLSTMAVFALLISTLEWQGLLFNRSWKSTRALSIPGAASRTPDLLLPLPASDRNFALLYLEKKHPPQGQWENWSQEEIDAELATVTAATKDRFQPLLDALAQAVPSARDLDATGRIGVLFDPAGARDEALDARLRGQIVTGDLRVGKAQDVYFVFYRRYPQCRSGEGGIVCRDATCPEGYCRLVIVGEVATQKE